MPWQFLLAKNLTFMKEINQENFMLQYIHYFDKDWPHLMQIDQQNVNTSMEYFINNMNS